MRKVAAAIDLDGSHAACAIFGENAALASRSIVVQLNPFLKPLLAKFANKSRRLQKMQTARKAAQIQPSRDAGA